MNVPARIRRCLVMPTSRRASLVAAGVVLVLVAAGAAALVWWPDDTRHAALRPPTPPRPVATSMGSTAGPSRAEPSTRETSCRRPARSPVSGTNPQRVCIPALRVDASVMELGLNADRTVQVPPLSRVGDAGWYKNSATAGAVGATVILGHVDSARYGAGVFFRLGRLHAGDDVVISRDDGKVATYRVDRVVEVSKRRFPSQAVYGATASPTLRLVTCGGRFDSATGNYLDNIIVYGALQSFASS